MPELHPTTEKPGSPEIDRKNTGAGSETKKGNVSHRHSFWRASFTAHAGGERKNDR